MAITTMGSEYWPRSPEGRVLGWLLAVYAFAIFGYITAAIASFFVRADRAEDRPEHEGSLEDELEALRREVVALRRTLEPRGTGGG